MGKRVPLFLGVSGREAFRIASDVTARLSLWFGAKTPW
jgi:hypothetical protein